MNFTLTRISSQQQAERAGQAGGQAGPTAFGRYEQQSCGAKGQGVFALSAFDRGELVVPGIVLMSAPQNDKYAFQAGRDEYVYEGALKELVNHSCEPNCGVGRNWRGALDLIARRAILPGEEITVDYAMHSYVIEHFPGSCLCGARECRGRITGWTDLPAERKAAYQGQIAPFLLELDESGGRSERGRGPGSRPGRQRSQSVPAVT
jgi:hypothetical protein